MTERKLSTEAALAAKALHDAMEARDQAETNVRLLQLSQHVGDVLAHHTFMAILPALSAESQAWWSELQPDGNRFTRSDAVAAALDHVLRSKLRVRMKVWTQPQTNKQFLVAVGFPDSKTGRVFAYALRDDGTESLTLTIEEWNALPWRYFIDDGAAQPTGHKVTIPDNGN